MAIQFGNYDIAVIGAGHAGCEAAMAAARLGFKTVIFAVNIDSIANMACNPSIGGTAKGQLVREIDALGGVMGKMADKTAIQTKLLNKAKGPAVYSPRAQIDRRRYQTEMKHLLELQENVDLKQAEIVKIMTVPGENGIPLCFRRCYTPGCGIRLPMCDCVYRYLSERKSDYRGAQLQQRAGRTFSGK